MLRLLWHIIPDTKSIWIGLTFIYGIWLNSSRKILDDLKIPFMTKVKDISFDQERILSDHFKTILLENDLRRDVQTHIKRLKEIKCYRWVRHNLWLPVRWQSTRKNGKTAEKLLGRTRVRPVLKK
jgi:small subunit ribosomal protein S13